MDNESCIRACKLIAAYLRELDARSDFELERIAIRTTGDRWVVRACHGIYVRATMSVLVDAIPEALSLLARVCGSPVIAHAEAERTLCFDRAPRTYLLVY